MKRKGIYYPIILILLALSLYSAFHLNAYYQESRREREVEEELSALAGVGELLALNGDFVGWLRIDGTGIDYPVVQAADNDYYLDRNFFREASRYGTLFVDYRCSLQPRSKNVIIYGHHMQDGSMFGELMEYGDRSFYQDHRIIRFDTLSGRVDYEIVAVIRGDAEDPEVMELFSFIDAADEASFDSRIAYLKGVSLYEMEAEVEFGDRLLTLATCEYTTENGRLVIVAREIHEEAF